jgi:AcrR family transcriptional regulator
MAVRAVEGSVGVKDTEDAADERVVARLDDGRLQRSRRTRNALEQAALHLFVRYGFDATTVEQIASAARVSTRTFFRHFETKDDLLVGDLRTKIERLSAALDSRPDDEPVLTVVRESILTVAAAYEDERNSVLLRAQLARGMNSVRARRLELGHLAETAIVRTCARRLGVDPDQDPRPVLIARTTLLATEIALERWVENDGRDDLAALYREMLDLLANDFGVHDAPVAAPPRKNARTRTAVT